MIAAKDRFREAAHADCRQVQQQTLHSLLQLNADSEFSGEHGLRADLNAEEFRSRVSVCDYEYYRPYVDRMTQGQHAALLGKRNRLLMFAVTSGTTSKSKLIPVTKRFVDDYRRGWQHWGMGLYQDHSELTLLRLVQISSAFDRDRTSDGTPCGNISGLAAARQRFLVRKLYSVPATVSAINHAVTKRLVLSAFAFADPFVGMFITANPSTLLQLQDTADQHAEAIIRAIADGSLVGLPDPQRELGRLRLKLRRNRERARILQQILDRHGSLDPSQCWSQLSCLGVWTGGSAGAYLDRTKQIFGQLPVRDHGLHASEGRMTIPFTDGTSDGLLDIESHFFEFIPTEEATSATPTVLMAHELQLDQDYEILLTTSSGLYRYNMYDVVRCTGFHGTTPVLRFLHKSAHMSSITGEKITESQVVEAVQAAETAVGVGLKQFTLTPVWGQPPGYQLFVNLPAAVTDEALDRLGLEVDRSLGQLNCEYSDKRETGRLRPIETIALPAADWQQFELTRLQRSGGSPEQYKHPCLVPDSQFQNVLIRQMKRQETSAAAADRSQIPSS